MVSGLNYSKLIKLAITKRMKNENENENEKEQYKTFNSSQMTL